MSKNQETLNHLLKQIHGELVDSSKATLERYHELCASITRDRESDSLKLNKLIDVFATTLFEGLPCVCLVSAKGDDEYHFLVDNKYGYMLKGYDDIPGLKEWADWVKSIICDKHVVTELKKTAEPEPILTTEQIYTPQEEEDFKRQSIEKMQAVRVAIVSTQQDIADTKFAEHAAELTSRVEELRSMVDQSNLSQTIQDLANLEFHDEPRTVDTYIEELYWRAADDGAGGKVPRSIVAAMIELMVINRSYYMQDSKFFKPTLHTISWSLPISEKVDVFVWAIANLHHVREVRHLRPFDDGKLAAYLLDYANRGSSLHVAVSPDEIVRLATSLYDLFAVHNFDTKFIYATDMNNGYEVDRQDWHLDNSVVNFYLSEGRNRALPTLTDANLDRILNIIDRRDVTMTIPKLHTEDISELNALLESIPSESNVYYHMRSPVTLLTGTYLHTDGVSQIKYILYYSHEMTASYLIMDAPVSQAYYFTSNAATFIKFIRLATSNIIP